MRDEIKDGDILLYRGERFGSKIIRAVTRSEYSHAGIVAWWHGRLMVLEAMSKGVRAMPISKNIRTYKGKVVWYRVKEPVKAEQREAMLNYAKKELGKDYGRLKMILLGAWLIFKLDTIQRRLLNRRNKLYCSEYVSLVYKAAGIDLEPEIHDLLMTPQDIANSPLVECMGSFTKESLN